MRFPLRGWVDRLFGPKPEQAREALQVTEFWCDKHWQVVEELGLDPFVATQAIAVGLYIAGLPAFPIRHACCQLTDDTVRGALERA